MATEEHEIILIDSDGEDEVNESAPTQDKGQSETVSHNW